MSRERDVAVTLANWRKPWWQWLQWVDSRGFACFVVLDFPWTPWMVKHEWEAS